VRRRRTAGRELDHLANARDRAADERDRAADERDRAADARDRVADERQRSSGSAPRGDHDEARDRELAALDRAAAARDRDRANQDREQARRERAQASLDDLTGALRRDRGLADLRREIDRARRADGRLVLAFVDVDGLKMINDTYGHAAGDQLLRDVVAALRARLRSYDLIVRYGGDEFVCALPGADMRTSQRRFSAVERMLNEKDARASVSVGLVELENADTLDDLIGRADAALYAVPARVLRPVALRSAR
jgi:diguanylate cyclase (GGDEF)-like protein